MVLTDGRTAGTSPSWAGGVLDWGKDSASRMFYPPYIIFILSAISLLIPLPSNEGPQTSSIYSTCISCYFCLVYGGPFSLSVWLPRSITQAVKPHLRPPSLSCCWLWPLTHWQRSLPAWVSPSVL